MAAGTVGYSDTRGGDRDYLGGIARSIGNRIKQASNMAREERAFAAKRAEEQGTSLEEAGIGKGYFFKRALGSRFGGDRIARTRGRFESDPPAGRDPTKNYKQRFRGGFDYKVTNQINELTSNAIVPMSSAIATGMRQVQVSVDGVSSALVQISNSMNNLATAQQDLARQAMMNGAFMRAFMTYMQRQQSRSNARAEERSIEGRMRQLPGGKGGSFVDIPALPSAGGSGGSKGPDLIDSLSRGRQVAKGAGSVVRGSTGRTIAKGAASAVKATQSAGTSIQAMVNTGKSLQNINPTGLFNMATRMGLQGPAAVDFVKQAQNTQELARNASSMERIVSGAKNANVEDAKTLQKFLEAPGDLVTNSNSLKAAGAAVDAGIDNPGFLKQLFSKKSVKGLARGSALQRAIIKAGGKSILKKIPVVAGIAGMIFGLQRLAEGDFLGAGLEFGSGILGAIGVGAPIGLAMDGMLLARDLGAVEFAKGGLVKGGRGGVLGMVGEGQRDELIEPVDKDLYTMKAEAEAEYRKKNPKPYVEIAAKGNEKYYDQMGGWESFAKAFKDIFEDLKEIFTGLVQGIVQKLNPMNWRLPNLLGGGGDKTAGNIDASKIDADSPQAKALIATIREVEGTAGAKGYDTWFGGRNEMKMTDMTLQQVYDEQTRRMNAGETTYNGLSSAAVGVGQFMDPLNQARAMYAARGEAFDPTKIKFDERLQNELLLDLAARKRGIDVNKTLTKADFDILQMEWAGLGTYYGQTKRTTADSLRIYQGNLKEASANKPKVSGVNPTPKDLQWWMQQTGSDTSSLGPQASPLLGPNALNSQSMFATGAMTLPPIVNNITNNYGANQQTSPGDSNSVGSPFDATGLSAFYQNYSLATK